MEEDCHGAPAASPSPLALSATSRPHSPLLPKGPSMSASSSYVVPPTRARPRGHGSECRACPPHREDAVVGAQRHVLAAFVVRRQVSMAPPRGTRPIFRDGVPVVHAKTAHIVTAAPVVLGSTNREHVAIGAQRQRKAKLVVSRFAVEDRLAKRSRRCSTRTGTGLIEFSA